MKSSAKATNRKTVDMDSAMLGYAAMLYSSVNLLTRGALHCPSGAASLHEYRGKLSNTTRARTTTTTQAFRVTRRLSSARRLR